MRPYSTARILLLTAMAWGVLCNATFTWAAAEQQPNMVPPPAKVAVKGPLSAPPADANDLKFGDMFKMPVGPRGLEPSDKLLALQGKHVRMVGYVANAEEATPGMLILSPMPVVMGDEDEKLVDDLPPTAVFVRLSPAYAKQVTPNFSGLVQLTGKLDVGPQEEADGHMSTTRLLLDDATSRLLVNAGTGLAGKSTSKKSASQMSASKGIANKRVARDAH